MFVLCVVPGWLLFTGQVSGHRGHVPSLRSPVVCLLRGHSTLHAGKVLGLLTTVLVLDPPNLVCRDVFGSYNCGLKGFHFGEL